MLRNPKLISITLFFILITVMSGVMVWGFWTTADTSNEFPPLEALGPPPIPADNKQSVDENGFPKTDDPKVELGRMLYFDTRLSGDLSLSCATCHHPDLGWTDGSDIGRGYPGTTHWRNIQTIVNSAYYKVELCEAILGWV